MYKEELLERNLHPLYRGRMKDYTVRKELVNMSCGDVIIIYIRAKNGVITEASWEGKGCAISQVSADLMCEKIRGQAVEVAKEMKWEDLEILEDVKLMPARGKCAALAWGALENLGIS